MTAREDPQLVRVETLAREAGVRLEFVHRLIAHGLVEPDPATQEARLYRREAAIQVARAARLQRDLGLNEAGAVLACELLTRIQELEDRLAAHGLS